jgi:ligand-binding sensor domain-containing protein/signal transduction histidine kinase
MNLSLAPRWMKYCTGISLLLFCCASCTRSSTFEIPGTPDSVTLAASAYQTDAAALPTGTTVKSETPEPLPPLPKRTTPVRFERVMDENANVLTGPSQVIQDQYGFIWVGSVDGLARYDGYHFKFFKHDLDDPQSLSSNQVTAVFEDQQGNLWVGTEGEGLDRFNRAQETFTHFRHIPAESGSLSEGRVNVIYEDSLGELWMGTSNGGLNRFEESTGAFIHYQNETVDPNSLASNTVYTIFEDSHGDLWVGTNNGLDRFDRLNGLFSHFQHDDGNPRSLSHNAVFAIQEDSRGNLWLGTYGGGLDRLDLETLVFTSYRFNAKDPTSLSSDIITSLLVDRSGMLWIGTMGGGISWMDPRTYAFTRYLYDTNNPHSLNSSYINSLFEDRAAIIWVSTARMLDKYDPFKEKFTQQFYREHVTAIYEDQQNYLWVGAFDGLYKYDQTIDQVTHYRHIPDDSNSLSEWRVTNIVEYPSGTLWIGTNGGGLNRFDSQYQSFTSYRNDAHDEQSIPSDVVTALYLDRRRILWVGTDKGLSWFERSTGKFYKLQISSAPDEFGTDKIVSALLEDQHGNLWIGTEGGGLKRYAADSGVLTTFRHDKNDPGTLRNNVVSALFEDSRGILWIGTEGGLHCFNAETESFGYYSIEHGLPDDEIFAILEDQNGNLWMSTNHGLTKFNPVTGVFRNYDAEDGLQDNQFSAAAVIRRKGEMLFGGVNGISSFWPDQISDNPYLPPIVLLAVNQDGQTIQIDQAVESLSELTLSGKVRNFEFEFAALSYSQPQDNQYAYLLEGYDTDWNYLANGRIGRYEDLPSGSYTLKLKGANDDGVWNEAGLAISLNVIPPFWQTRWFWSLMGVILIGSAIAGYRIRLASVQARNKELEEQIVERTKESEIRRKELEALYQADGVMHRFLTLDPLLQALVDVTVDIMLADMCAVYALSSSQTINQGEATQLVMRVGRDIPPLCQVFKDEVAKWLRGLKAPTFVADARQVSELDHARWDLAQLMLEQGVYSWMFLPIYIHEEFFGVFNVCYTHPYAFEERNLRLFQALVQRACLAIENARLYENAQELAAIKERNRLARDLHDSVKQKTFAALAQIGASLRLVSNQPETAKNYMEEAESLVHDVLQELVTLIQEMYPLNLHGRSLEQTLRAYANQWAHRTGILVKFHIRGKGQLPSSYTQAFYRVFQEALANVARHSQADKVEIELNFNGVLSGSSQLPAAGLEVPTSAMMKISDNGCGFDQARVQAGIGLLSMQERVENLGGKLRIDSCLKKGTRVEVFLPGIDKDYRLNKHPEEVIDGNHQVNLK